MLLLPRVLFWGRVFLLALLRSLPVATASSVTHMLLMTWSPLFSEASDPLLLGHLCLGKCSVWVGKTDQTEASPSVRGVSRKCSCLWVCVYVRMFAGTHRTAIVNCEADSQKCFSASYGWVYLINNENFESLARYSSLSSCLFVKSLSWKAVRSKSFMRGFLFIEEAKHLHASGLALLHFYSALPIDYF